MSYTDVHYDEYYSGGKISIGRLFNEHQRRRTILEPNQLEEVNYFEGIDEFLEVVEGLDREMLLKNVRERTIFRSSGLDSEMGSSSFTGSESFEESLDRIKNPGKYYSKEVEGIKSATHKYLLKNQLSSKPIGVEYGVSGLIIDIGKYLQGEPECFMDLTNIDMTSRPTVKLVIGHNLMPGSMGTGQIVTYARRVSILYNTLLSMGCIVELKYLKASNICAACILLTDGTEYMQIADLYALMHPATYRRLIFRLIEKSRLFEDGYGRGYVRCDVDYLYIEDVNDADSDHEFVMQYLKSHGLYGGEEG